MRGTKTVDIHERLTDERTWTTLGRLAAGVAIATKTVHGFLRRRGVKATREEFTAALASVLDEIHEVKGSVDSMQDVSEQDYNKMSGLYLTMSRLEARVIDINSRLEGLENYGQRQTDF